MQTKTLLKTVLDDLSNLKAIHVVPLDVHQLTSVTDYMVIASGNSSRHVGAIAEHLVEDMKTRGITPLGIEADPNNEWVLVDLGDIVVHVMQPQTRDFYQLEKLWSEAHSHIALA
jgi:ribosome-associated protein